MVRICIRDLLPCFLRVLNMNQPKNKANELKQKPISSGSNWKKIKAPVKCYLNDILSVNLYYLLKAI
jgi:hypothetical protein